MRFNDEIIDKIKKFVEIKNRGYYCNSKEVTDTYNYVFEKNMSNTVCGSCIRNRIQQLEDALNHQEELEAKQAQIKAAEALKNDEVNNTPKEENNASQEPQKRSGGRKKKQ